MDLEPDFAPGEDRPSLLRGRRPEDADEPRTAEEEDTFSQPIADAAIDLATGARYRATGKRKTAVARVILMPGTGAYKINGRTLDEFFPRTTLQRTIRQPLETVGYEDRMDVIALDARRRRLGPGRRAAPRHLPRAAGGRSRTCVASSSAAAS